MWAVNDVPLGIGESDTRNKVRSYPSHRILSTVREIRVAKKLKDFSRVNVLESTLRQAGESMCLPLH